MKLTAFSLLMAQALAGPTLMTSDLDKRQSPPPDQIVIVSAQTSGSGCPQGTVSSSMSADRTIVTFGFDAFQTYIGPNTKPQDKSKNCQIHLSLRCKFM
jgi:hypothetical protein